MKIIYLDIDGVLNCETAFKNDECKYVKHNDLDGNFINYHQAFYSKSKYWLNKLIKETDAKIVISSTWRSSGIEWLREVWKHEEMEGEIIDITPSFITTKLGKEPYTIPRGCEIDYHLKNVMKFSHINWCKDTQQEYIDKSGVDNYIIIDDDADMLYGQKNHFVQVLPSPRNKDGFGEEHYKLGKELLNKTVIDLNYPEENKSTYRTYTMDELWDLIADKSSKVFVKPKFPTRRWGNITTKTATTDKTVIEKGIKKLKELGYTVRKRIEHETTKQHKGKKFYKIEIKNGKL